MNPGCLGIKLIKKTLVFDAELWLNNLLFISIFKYFLWLNNLVICWSQERVSSQSRNHRAIGNFALSDKPVSQTQIFYDSQTTQTQETKTCA